MNKQTLMWMKLLAMATAANAQPIPTVEQQLDELIARHSDKPIAVTVGLPEEGKVANVHPTLVASAAAVADAKALCTMQGGSPKYRVVINSNSSALVPTVGCMQGDTATWYLDFERKSMSSFELSAGQKALVTQVQLGITRFMPSDERRAPVLHWLGTYERAANGSGFEPKDEAKTLNARVGDAIGFSYSWRFSAPDIQLLEAVWTPASPGIQEAGKPTQTEIRTPHTFRDRCNDPYACNVVWSFDTPNEIVPGKWQVSLIADGKALISAEFDIKP